MCVSSYVCMFLGFELQLKCGLLLSDNNTCYNNNNKTRRVYVLQHHLCAEITLPVFVGALPWTHGNTVVT